MEKSDLDAMKKPCVGGKRTRSLTLWRRHADMASGHHDDGAAAASSSALAAAAGGGAGVCGHNKPAAGGSGETKVNKAQKEKQEEEQQQFCSVCFGSGGDSLNEIKECQRCSVTVHKKCCAVQPANTQWEVVEAARRDNKPKWYCRRCETEKTTRLIPQCAICGWPGGTLKDDDLKETTTDAFSGHPDPVRVSRPQGPCVCQGLPRAPATVDRPPPQLLGGRFSPQGLQAQAHRRKEPRALVTQNARDIKSPRRLLQLRNKTSARVHLHAASSLPPPPSWEEYLPFL
ncbi:unnamed protein product [Vitrella brassicaformis CCMP3155]|uniref:PHD-type domain-containing protein n=1 Tax=Vitrella brassicaformis (strain CCMP3155) TaxID=1169540 RepID=A0A0G4GKX4_VITBC|nr:unnamed protein product [Vitrella brassicaformis CCMP3155]|eukprot:CEM30682.1 unnamed protein product [Vitrella brassicaformis CCMP3155]